MPPHARLTRTPTPVNLCPRICEKNRRVTDSDSLGAPRYSSLAPRAAPSPAPPRAPPLTLLARAARTGEEVQCVNCSQCSTALLASKVICGSCHTSRAEHLSFGVVVSVEVRPFVFMLADYLRAAIEKAKEPGLVRTGWVHMSLGTFKAVQDHPSTRRALRMGAPTGSTSRVGGRPRECGGGRGSTSER